MAVSQPLKGVSGYKGLSSVPKGVSGSLGVSAYSPVINYNFLLSSIPPSLTYSRASNATYYNSAGVLVSAANNVPRFDYNPSTLVLNGLLMEPNATTNLVEHSIPDSGTYWSFNSASATTAATISPDGLMDATSLIDNAANDRHYTQYTPGTSFASGTTYTLSCFAKANGQSVVQLTYGVSGFASTQYANFNLANGTVGGTGSTNVAQSIQALSNGWYRCSLTATANASAAAVVALGLVNNVTSAARLAVYSGGTGTGVYVFGVQCEAAPSASSYLPTTGSTVTRAADSLYTTNLSFYNTTKGTLQTEWIMEGTVNAFPSTACFVGSSTGTDFIDGGEFSIPAGQNPSISAAGVAVAGVTTSSGSSPLSVVTGKVYKMASSWAVGQVINFAVNATNYTGSSTVSATPTIVQFNIASGAMHYQTLPNMWIRKASYWNYQLTPSQLASITT
jgi:hypothetical protein